MIQFGQKGGRGRWYTFVFRSHQLDWSGEGAVQNCHDLVAYIYLAAGSVRRVSCNYTKSPTPIQRAIYQESIIAILS
jgi:hypothetical protein